MTNFWILKENRRETLRPGHQPNTYHHLNRSFYLPLKQPEKFIKYASGGPDQFIHYFMKFFTLLNLLL